MLFLPFGNEKLIIFTNSVKIIGSKVENIKNSTLFSSFVIMKLI